MKTLLLLLALISASHAMASSEQDITEAMAVNQALSEVDAETRKAYFDCLELEEELNCEQEYLGDIYN